MVAFVPENAKYIGSLLDKLKERLNISIYSAVASYTNK
jgi:hypothetical protein